MPMPKLVLRKQGILKLTLLQPHSTLLILQVALHSRVVSWQTLFLLGQLTMCLMGSYLVDYVGKVKFSISLILTEPINLKFCLTRLFRMSKYLAKSVLFVPCFKVIGSPSTCCECWMFLTDEKCRTHASSVISNRSEASSLPFYLSFSLLSQTWIYTYTIHTDDIVYCLIFHRALLTAKFN